MRAPLAGRDARATSLLEAKRAAALIALTLAASLEDAPAARTNALELPDHDLRAAAGRDLFVRHHHLLLVTTPERRRSVRFLYSVRAAAPTRAQFSQLLCDNL